MGIWFVCEFTKDMYKSMDTVGLFRLALVAVLLYLDDKLDLSSTQSYSSYNVKYVIIFVFWITYILISNTYTQLYTVFNHIHVSLMLTLSGRTPMTAEQMDIRGSLLIEIQYLDMRMRICCRRLVSFCWLLQIMNHFYYFETRL